MYPYRYPYPNWYYRDYYGYYPYPEYYREWCYNPCYCGPRYPYRRCYW